mmetsp:Transcript_37590/g.81616  ORF Transcript_37590/g.81616 Transcript_37590/m.81616 type:complete len:89 (-) Transcript_37590:404-670(-)
MLQERGSVDLAKQRFATGRVVASNKDKTTRHTTRSTHRRPQIVSFPGQPCGQQAVDDSRKLSAASVTARVALGGGDSRFEWGKLANCR